MKLWQQSQLMYAPHHIERYNQCSTINVQTTINIEMQLEGFRFSTKKKSNEKNICQIKQMIQEGKVKSKRHLLSAQAKSTQ